MCSYAHTNVIYIYRSSIPISASDMYERFTIVSVQTNDLLLCPYRLTIYYCVRTDKRFTSVSVQTNDLLLCPYRLTIY